MKDWNVVVTTPPMRFTLACELMGEFGPVARTHFYNVLVMKVEDTVAFLSGVSDMRSRNPGHFDFAISRIVPAARAFNFQTPEEFEKTAGEIVLTWVPDLAEKSFHVRFHRRGFKGELSSQKEEQFLDDIIFHGLELAGAMGKIAFDDPDAILSVETIDNRAGMSLWSREDLLRYPFLRLD